MDCDDVAGRLLPYIDGALSDAESEAVRRHVASCSSCGDEHAAELALCAELDASTAGLAGPSFTDSVMRELDATGEAAPGAVVQFYPWARWTVAPMAAAAAILLAILGARSGEAGAVHEQSMARAYEGAATWGSDISAILTALAQSSAYGCDAIASEMAIQSSELGSVVQIITVFAALCCAALVAKFRMRHVEEPRA